MSNWAKKYIGIPYKELGRDEDGLDCWGLVRLIYTNECGIMLPSFDTEYKSVKDFNINKIIEEQRPNWTEIKKPQEFAVALINNYGMPFHVGVIVNNKGDMIHSMEKRNTCIENIYSNNWKNKLVGIFTYA